MWNVQVEKYGLWRFKNMINHNTSSTGKVVATEDDIAHLRTELKTDIANSKNDMIKWFFTFFMALALMIIGLYFKK